MFRKLNNKGNTLAIVLIGIFVLSILGTLILGVTSTNYKMKCNDKKNETTFYYAEQAVDELYAGIGNDVMDIVANSYNEVLETYASSGALADKTIANDKFEDLLHDGISSKYADGTISTVPGKAPADIINDMLSDMETHINSITNYSISLYSPATVATKVEYYKKTADPTVASGYVLNVLDSTAGDDYGDIDVVKIINVGIKCESGGQGFASSIITDFKIDIPDIKVDFTDSQSLDGLKNLVQYAVIAEGSNLQKDAVNNNNRGNAAINIDLGKNVTISGNIYANGTVYDVDKTKLFTKGTIEYYKNESNVKQYNNSIVVGSNATLNINSKIVNCVNDFILNTSSNSTLKNRAGAEKLDDFDTLQFYVKNIKTTGGSVGKGATLLVAGNCIVKDDLEINGDYSNITLKGNYFGYGFRGNIDTLIESDTNALDNLETALPVSPVIAEHEKSSAIIINGTHANVNLEGLDKLVLAGRAYIDLDASGTNKSYMTGESVSFKGNQSIYLADEELAGSKVVGNNPVTRSDLGAILGKTILDNFTNVSKSDLGLASSDKVVGKVLNEKMYFYVKNVNPIAQTTYFENAYNDTVKKQKLIEQIKTLNVENFSISSKLHLYTVGTIMTVSTAASGATEVTKPILVRDKSVVGAISDETFEDTIKSANNRIENLIPFLNDISTQQILGTTYNYVTPDLAGTTSVYEYYLDREKVMEVFANNGSRTIDFGNLNTATSVSDKLEIPAEKQAAFIDGLKTVLKNNGYTDGDLSSKKFGIAISAEGGSSAPEIEIDAGIIISEGPCTINKNFKGLVLVNGEVYINGNVTIESCEELSKYLFENVPMLRKIISSNISIGSISSTDNVVTAGNLKYTDIVSKSNWRKDTN